VSEAVASVLWGLEFTDTIFDGRREEPLLNLPSNLALENWSFCICSQMEFLSLTELGFSILN